MLTTAEAIRVMCNVGSAVTTHDSAQEATAPRVSCFVPHSTDIKPRGGTGRGEAGARRGEPGAKAGAGRGGRRAQNAQQQGRSSNNLVPLTQLIAKTGTIENRGTL